jgi:hypothetical protein
MPSLKEIVDYTKNILFILGIVGTAAAWIHNTFIVDEIKGIAYKSALKAIKDEVPEMIKDGVKDKKGGFRHRLSEYSGVPVDSVEIIAGAMIKKRVYYDFVELAINKRTGKESYMAVDGLSYRVFRVDTGAMAGWRYYIKDDGSPAGLVTYIYIQ